MNCTCNPIYVKILAARLQPKQGHVMPFHEDKCISTAERALDFDLASRIAWERTEDCTARTSHGPHGKCSGLTYDRT